MGSLEINKSGKSEPRKVIRCSITFMDGRETAFVWENNDENLMRATSILEHMLKNQSIALVVNGNLLIIPLNNVRSVLVNPAPGNLAGHIVHDAWMT